MLSRLFPTTNMQSLRLLPLCLALVVPVYAADYHVDFADGEDSRDGHTPATAFKHCPGDKQATGTAAGVELQPGDRVLFKGGVIYRGSIGVTASGAPDRPIVFDGSAWGEGRAVVHGGVAVTGWKRCATAAEAKGNPRWADIYHADVPSPKNYGDINLCDAEAPLAVAQHPNPKDFFWQENTDNYLVSKSTLKAVGDLLVVAEPGTRQDKSQPITNLLTGSLAVISPVPGAALTFTLGKPTPITAIGLALQPRYSKIKDVAVLTDGKELLRFTVAPEDKGAMQRFELPAPVEVSLLTFQFLSLHEGSANDWSKLKQLAAFTASGENVLAGADTMTFTDPANLNQPEADYYDGMSFAFHAGNNHVFTLPIKTYDPATGTLSLPVFSDTQYKETRYCFFNSVRLIDSPGEYSVEATADPKVARVYLLPRKVAEGAPVDISRAATATGFSLDKANHVVIQGFSIRQQNKHGLHAVGPAKDFTFRDSEITQVRGSTGVSGTKLDGVLLEDLTVHDNPGHTKGIVLHTCTAAMTRDCHLQRNTSTALDYYVCSDSQVVGNTVVENLGSHANGLTFYVGCKNILVERNHVSNGNVALTFQEIDGITIRNNLFDGSGRTAVVGIWPTQPTKNVNILNNTIVRGDADSDWTVGLFSNSRKIEGLVVKNNIIDGVFSDHGVFRGGDFSNNLFTRIAKDQKAGPFGQNELVEPDLKKIFVDSDNGDFSLRPGSPAINAGTDVGITQDITGKPRPQGNPDLGAFAR